MSCGSDNNLMGKGSSSSTSTLSGECKFDSSYSPVCGSNNITYDNISIATCKGATLTSQGNCLCSERPVCGDNGVTYTECDAQAAIRSGEIRKITKFVGCNSTAPTL